MHKNELDQRLRALAARLAKHQADMKLSQRQLLRWTMIRQQKNFYARRSNHLKHWCRMQMRHLGALKKKMAGIRTEVVAIKAVASQEAT